MPSNDDYLWSGTGEPDADLATLERALAEVPGPPPPPAWPERAPVRLRRVPALAWPLAAAAALAIGWAAAGSVARTRGWDVQTLAGRPHVGGWAGAFARLGPGAALETGPGTRARVTVGDIGWLDVEPGSRLRLVQAIPGRQRVALDQGELHAVVTAPPRTFVVDTPGAVATDLGCAYRLRVDAHGESDLLVTAGWVAFTHEHRESFVPAGAACRTWPGRGPGTPHWEDADVAWVAALDACDARGTSIVPEAFERVLAGARPRDALTLWHLLPRTEGDARRRVAERLAALVPPPADASIDRAVALERRALDAWWDALGLGESDFFRAWEGEFPGAPVDSR